MRDENFHEIKRDLVDKIQIAILKIDDIHREVKEHGKIIIGDPLTKTRGIVERINSIEDAHIKKEKWSMAITVSVIGIVVKQIMDFFHHSK